MKIIKLHRRIHPGFSARDAYKLLYQRHMGAEHMISNVESARQYLYDELAMVIPDETIPLLEPLWENFEVVRINLTPFKARGIDPEKLLTAFLDSSKSSKGGFESFMQEWADLMEMVKNGLVNFDRDDFEKVNEIAFENNYPPMHHSEEYAKLNHPAYRLARCEPLLKNIPEISGEIGKFKF